MNDLLRIRAELDSLSQRPIPIEALNKKLEAIQYFLLWLKKQNQISEKEYAKIQLQISNLRSLKVNESEKNSSVEEKHSSKHKAYKKINLNFSFLQIFSTVVVVVILVLLIYTIYLYSRNRTTQNVSLDQQNSVNATGRVLTYRGTLIDKQGKIIDYKTDAMFKLYDRGVGGNPLYVGACIGQEGLVPQFDGSFTVTIGKDCGMREIPASIFNSSSDLFLGITLGTDKEMSPRQNIAKVGYAVQADKLKGLSLGKGNNTIPFIDEQGRLLIDATSPVLQSSSGTFTVEGQAITLQTTKGQQGSIILQPDNNTIIASGYLGVGNVLPTAKLDVAGTASISGNLVFRGLESKIAQLNGGQLAFATSDTGDNQLVNRMVITNSGNVGIGVDSPTSALSVVRTNYKSQTVSLNNSSLEDDGSTSTLRLGLGTAATGTNAKFIQFYASATSDSNGVAVGRIRLNNGNVAYETGGADFAEYFTTSESVSEGEVVMLGGNGIKKGLIGEPIYGVVSNVAGFVGNTPKDTDTTKKAVVGLVGQVNTFVSTRYGSIVMGDMIGGSDIAGIGGKATKAGYVIGRIMDAPTSSQLTNDQCPAQSRGLTDPQGNPVKCGKLPVLVQPTWYDPGYIVSNTGSYSRIGSSSDISNINNKLQVNEFESSLAQFADIIVNNILKANKVVAETVTATNVQVSKLTASIVQSNAGIFNTLESNTLRSPVITSDHITTNDLKTDKIQSKSGSMEIQLATPEESQNDEKRSKFAELAIKNAENQTVASIDNRGNATFSGTIESNGLRTQKATITNVQTKNLVAENANVQNLQTQQASVSGSLYAKNIVADNINSLQSDLQNVQSILSGMKQPNLPNPENYQTINQSQLAQTTAISSSAAQLDPSMETLTVTKNANFYAVSVTNTLSLGKLFLTEDSINSLSYTLHLSALSTIDFFDGKVTIDKNGAIVTKNTLTAEGGIKTNSIESNTGGIQIQLQNATNNERLVISNKDGQEVSSIDSQGKAQFRELAIDKYLDATSPAVLITPADNLKENGINAPALETRAKSAGVGFVPQGSNEVVIFNDRISQDSLVYLTPTSQNVPQTLAVSEKKTCSTETVLPKCKSYFKVTMNQTNSSPIYFNWLVIN